MPALTYKYESFGDTLEFAEGLGWVDENITPWSPDAADFTEESALDFIRAKGYVIEDADEVESTFTAKCPECGRVFNLMNDTEAQEWAFGHDCEVN